MRIKIILIIILSFTLCGCNLIDEEKDRDIAIEECKNAGGIPYVENYDDSAYRPIVHCKFDEDSDNKDE